MAFKPITVNTPAADPAHILAEDDAALYESIIGGDCVLPIGQKMAATVQSNNKVRIADGVVLVGGHVGRIVNGDYEDMTIANGQSGQKRNDIIAARFLAGSSGGSDSYSLVVIQGTPGTSATDPVVVKGDLYAGDNQRDYPLWRVCIDGLSITKVEQMYEVGVTNKDLAELKNSIRVGTFDDTELIPGAHHDISVTFSTPMPDANYGVLTEILVPGSGDPSKLFLLVLSREDTGFTCRIYNNGTVNAGATTWCYNAKSLSG